MNKTPFPEEFPYLKVLGDAHIGKRFLNDVPLHRRGEREAMVRTDLFKALTEGVTGWDAVVQTGDILDGFVVDLASLLFVADTFIEAQRQTRAQYFIYRGNHDASREEKKRSSFDVLQAILASANRITVVSECSRVHIKTPAMEMTLGFMPWHPFDSAEVLAQNLADYEDPFDVIFTHCDLDTFGGQSSTFNLLPYATLAKVTNKVVNGHIHTPEVREVGGLTVYMPGSLQPYSHSEDPEEVLYTTKTLREFLVSGPDDFINKNLRVLLEEGEEAPTDIPNCLSFTVKRVKVKDEIEEDDSEVHVEDFDMKKIIQKQLQLAGVNATITSKITGYFDDIRNKEV